MFILGLPGSPHFSPQMQLNNTHISANNPENHLKTGRINSATKCREKATLKRVGRGKTVGSKTLWVWALEGGGREQWASREMRNRLSHWRACKGKMNSLRMWLGKSVGLNFISSYNKQDLKPWTLKISRLSSGRAQEVTGTESLPLKRYHNKQPYWNTAQMLQFEKCLGYTGERVSN